MMFWISCGVILLLLCTVIGGNIPPPPSSKPLVSVNKCCEKYELMLNSRCRHMNETDATAWSPVFSDGFGRDNIQVSFKLLIGVPNCGPRQHFTIYHLGSPSPDRLLLLPNGHLRHYFLQNSHQGGEELWEEEAAEQRFYDYEQGLYCLDKAIQEDEGLKPVLFALVCNPDVPTTWQNTDFLLRRIVDPTLHVISLICYVVIAIIHFVLPQLRDLVGNFITTLCVCLAFGQISDIVRIFTEFGSPTSFLVADIVMYVSLLGAFFWLNSVGYYIWKTFRSRNMFLRITDGRKYCYYSFYVWGCTIGMSLMAVFAHFTLDATNPSKAPTPIAQGALGWLGIAVFFTPIACLILVNIYFYISTMQIINSMSAYGRIHHKMKFSFETFVKLFLVMTVCWMFLLLSWLPFNGMYYCYILSNALQAPIILYICVFSQKRVRFLLRKACCYEKCICPCCRPQESEGPEWGEEMMAMNR